MAGLVTCTASQRLSSNPRGPLLAEPSKAPDETSAAAAVTVSWVARLELLRQDLFQPDI
jgi:hypothetical protein